MACHPESNCPCNTDDEVLKVWWLLCQNKGSVILGGGCKILISISMTCKFY